MEQRWMSQRFFIFFFTWGVFLPYWTVWLTEQGMSVAQAGIIISVGLLVRGFSQLFIFPAISARTTVMTLQLAIPLVALASLLLFLGNDSFLYLMGAMVLFSLSYPALLPLNETSASLLTQLDTFDYGRSRQWGSIGFTVALASTGVFLDWSGANAIIWAIAVSLFLLALHARMEAPRVFTVPSKSNALAGWGELLKNREFLFVLGIVTLVQSAHAIYNTFAAPYAIALGAPESSVGLILTIAVLAEIVCFNVARRSFEPMPIRTLLIIATVASVIRWGVLAFVDSLLVFALSQILHSLTFALTHMSFMWYASQSLPQRLFASAQGMYAAFGMSFGAGILTLLSSDLYAASPMMAYGVMAVNSGVAFVFTLFYRKGVTAVES